MEIAWIMGGFFAFVTIVFIAIAFFFPEWVGITGDQARKTMAEQAGDLPSESNLNKPKSDSSQT